MQTVIAPDRERAVEGRLTGWSVVDWFLSLLNGRRLLAALVRRDIDLRYRGSVFGIAWIVMAPILLAAVYTYASGVVFGSRFTDGGLIASALSIYVGVVCFNMFTEPLVRSFPLVHEMAPFVKKVAMPVRVLPIVPVGTMIVTSTASLGVLSCMLLVAGRIPSLTGTAIFLALLVPYYMGICGMCWIGSAAGAYVRDLKHVASFAVTGLLFLTPIFYPASAVPSAMKAISVANPVAFIVDAARKLLLTDEVPTLSSIVAFCLVSFALCSIGYAVFRRAQKGFADVV